MGYTRGHVVVLKREPDGKRQWYCKCANCGWESARKGLRREALTLSADHNWEDKR